MKKRERFLTLLLGVLLPVLAACGESPEPVDPSPSPLPPEVVEQTSAPRPVPSPLPTPEPTEEPVPTPTPNPGTRIPPELAEYGEAEDEALGTYQYLVMEHLTPFVFAPNGAGSAFPEDFTDPTQVLRRFGAANGLVVAINAGIFYDGGEGETYCFRQNEADGVVIAGGTVLKSAESIDHSQCDILVVDEDGNCGWADWYADADALAAGSGSYHNIYGETVTGKRIVSAVTGFVPILVDGENVYDPEDTACSGYDNYVNHYGWQAWRQVFGVRADGAGVVLTNARGWTLREAADAAKALDCVFAYNLDGGNSVETAAGYDIGSGYRVDTLLRRAQEAGRYPTFLVFSTSDTPPVSATPLSLLATVEEGAVFHPGVTLEELAGALRVSEYFRNADGYISERRLYSAQARTPGSLIHVVVSGEDPFALEARLVTESPDGTPYYTKSEEETARSLARNGNTRADGTYYDYSTGFTVDTAEDLSTPGEKVLTVSYTPGGSAVPLVTEVRVLLEEE